MPAEAWAIQCLGHAVSLNYRFYRARLLQSLILNVFANRSDRISDVSKEIG